MMRRICDNCKKINKLYNYYDNIDIILKKRKLVLVGV